MNSWLELDGLAYKVDETGKRHRWLEYCVRCRARTHIRIEEGVFGPGRMPAKADGSSALAFSISEVELNNRVHYARCSACGWLSPRPLEFR
jgi:hypothetical protein